VVILVAPRHIRRLFRHDDCTEVIAFRIPHPNTFRPGNKEIALPIDLDPVGNTVVFLSMLIAQGAAIPQSLIWRYVVGANVALLAVIHVESLAVGRESQSVRLRQIAGE
jgi:hypothetical protein